LLAYDHGRLLAREMEEAAFRTHFHWIGGWQGPFVRRGATATERAAVEALADDSWAWLAEHLPTTVFSEPVEKAIESASGLRYRA
jgi:hypothetical protein